MTSHQKRRQRVKHQFKRYAPCLRYHFERAEVRVMQVGIPHRDDGAALIDEPHRPFLGENENIGEQQINAGGQRHLGPVLRKCSIRPEPNAERAIDEYVHAQDHHAERPIGHKNSQCAVAVEQPSAVSGVRVVLVRQHQRNQKTRNHKKALHGHSAVHDVIAPDGSEMTEGNRQREQESKRAQYRPPRARYLKQDAALKANLVAPRCLIERTGRCGAKPPEPWHRSTPKRGLNEDTDSSSTRAALAARYGLGCESVLAKSGFARRFRISPIDRRAASAAPMVQGSSSSSPVEWTRSVLTREKP